MKNQQRGLFDKPFEPAIPNLTIHVDLTNIMRDPPPYERPHCRKHGYDHFIPISENSVCCKLCKEELYTPSVDVIVKTEPDAN